MQLILKKSKREHASPLLEELHWLPCDKRIAYKLATICHKCIHGKAPTYLKELLKPYVPSRSLRSSLDTTKLIVPKMRLKTLGERSFEFSAPKLWNSLPQHLREFQTFSVFKKHLKTYLFKN